MDKVRLNSTLPVKINEQLEQYCKEYGITKSGAIALILGNYFEQREMLERSKSIPDWISAIQLTNKPR